MMENELREWIRAAVVDLLVVALWLENCSFSWLAESDDELVVVVVMAAWLNTGLKSF